MHRTDRRSSTSKRIRETEAEAVTFVVDHFQKLAAHLGPDLEGTDWDRRREVILTLVERVEVGHASLAIVFRLPHGIAVANKDPIVVTLSRR
jgi:hypothetical protein